MASAGGLAGLGGRREEAGLTGVGGPFRTAGRREPAGDGDRCRRTLPTEGVGEQIDEGVDRHRIVVGVVGDELLPPVEMAGCTARILDLANQAASELPAPAKPVAS